MMVSELGDFGRLGRAIEVLILVLVDDGLGAVTKDRLKWVFLVGLNPCFSG